MSSGDGIEPIEYPDAAGYPDGTGWLDEGTAAVVDEVTADALRVADRPSADADADIEVHRRDAEHVYAAVIEGIDVASLRFDEVEDRVVLVATSVVPGFRGRGIAANLIADVLDDLRDRGRPITVRCPAVAAFLRGNPEYADLVDGAIQ
jgi:predicted GNAT family acetyltransferase